ncbi:DUF3558 domain-containing protein [Actinosynnema sp. NPDC023587]|uniref:DUF3558 domain-containing protein n=1 Tax=Actinosynnema sp. NPDC023587 TaxID=3154695 RepID=UPI0033F43263
MRRSLPVVLTVASVLALGACADEGGRARPGSTAAPTTTTLEPSPSADRPREVKLDGKKPCELLTPVQLTGFSIDREGEPLEVPTLNATGCQWTVTGAANMLVPVTADGIEVWTDGKRAGQPTAVDPISGFKAITLTIPSNPHRCDVLVDTAAGQYLAAGFSLATDKPERFPKPCDRARELAEAAMQNLLK